MENDLSIDELKQKIPNIMHLKDKTITIIEQFIIELACNNTIDNRNYDRSNDAESLLKMNIAEKKSLQLGIIKTVDDLFEDEDFLSCLNSYYELNNSLESNNGECNIEIKDEMNDLQCDLFSFFIRTVGLFTILNLHADSYDNFLDNFLSIFFK